MLLQEGCDPDAEDAFGRTPIWWATMQGEEEAARLLISAGAKADLLIAAGLGDIDLARQFLRSGGEMNLRDKDGRMPLHWAAHNGHVEMIEWLISNGAKLDFSDEAGEDTPLHVAAYRGQEGAVSILLEHGADVNARGNALGTPLHRAVSSRRGGSVIKLLIAGGADVNARDNLQYTPLYMAVRSGNEELTELMLSGGGEIDLFVAAGTDDVSLIEKLVAEGADVNAVDGLSYAPLHWAAENGKLSAAEALVAKGADVNYGNKFGYTPLHLAVSGQPTPPSRLPDIWPFRKQKPKGNIDVARFLVLNGADPNAKDECGRTPLGSAHGKGYSDLVSLMQKHCRDAE